jgi:hypothetical protein
MRARICQRNAGVLAGWPGAVPALIEDLSERELQVLHRHYQRLAEMARHEAHVDATHSVAEAEQRHRRKRKLT